MLRFISTAVLGSVLELNGKVKTLFDTCVIHILANNVQSEFLKKYQNVLPTEVIDKIRGSYTKLAALISTDNDALRYMNHHD